MKSKEKGDLALSQAISYFMLHGYEVCLPIGDKRSWDIIIEKEGNLQKVQVKYAGLYSRDSKCKAGLRITGGNQSYFSTKKYADNDFDILFVYTERGDKYSFPWKEILVRNELTVEDNKYQQYKV
jgi:hypothetical protein